MVGEKRSGRIGRLPIRVWRAHFPTFLTWITAEPLETYAFLKRESPGHSARAVPLVPSSTHSEPTISERTIWLIAVGLILVDVALFVVPVVPFVVAYVLVARPPWFKMFVDELYESQ